MDNLLSLEKKTSLLNMAFSSKALGFGSFQLRSGRNSPYFFNTASFHHGQELWKLGGFYAEVLALKFPHTTLVYGPAYKGIPLCVVIAVQLGKLLERNIGYVFNRKEEKAHGDKGLFVGCLPEKDDRVVLVDDVLTDGGTKHEAVESLEKVSGLRPEGLVVAFDRKEKDEKGVYSLKAFEEKAKLPVYSLLSFPDLLSFLHQKPALAKEWKEPLEAYFQTYGVFS